MKRPILKISIVLVVICIGILFYPREIVLVPEMHLTVTYEGGQVVNPGEVSRTWNHYLGDGWKSKIERTDDNGNVTFAAETKRVPLTVQLLLFVASPLGHYYPGMAGNVVARDPSDHSIWKRTDFNDENCCPKEIVISIHEDEGEAEDKYFTFGETE